MTPRSLEDPTLEPHVVLPAAPCRAPARSGIPQAYPIHAPRPTGQPALFDFGYQTAGSPALSKENRRTSLWLPFCPETWPRIRLIHDGMIEQNLTFLAENYGLAFQPCHKLPEDEIDQSHRHDRRSCSTVPPSVPQATAVDERRCCVGGGRQNYLLCCFNQMARTSSAKIAVSGCRRAVSGPSCKRDRSVAEKRRSFGPLSCLGRNATCGLAPLQYLVVANYHISHTNPMWEVLVTRIPFT